MKTDRREYHRQYNRLHRVKKIGAAKAWTLANKDKRRAYEKAYRQRNKERRKTTEARYRERHRDAIQARRFGLTGDELSALRVAQNDACAICGDVTVLCIDHDHETGTVRGLLCGTCNSAIGLLKDSVAVMTKAAMYLQRTKAKSDVA